MTGILYGIGVGTGDSDLITLKGYKILQSVDSIAYIKTPTSPSMSHTIASPHIPQGIQNIVLTMPMRTDTTHATAIYDTGADTILHAVQNNKRVAFLCEGDPMFYGSFMYIYERLHTHIPIEIVAGISSVCAGCSVAQIPFASRQDICSIIPATAPYDKILATLENADSIAILKIGRHLEKIKRALDTYHMLKTATCVLYATMDTQRIVPLQDLDTAPYFAIAFAHKKRKLYA